MKQYNYIYKITNLENGKIYIGKHSTDNLNDSYMGSGKLIKKAISKYGKNAFKKDIIAFSDNEESLNFLERFYIKKYKSQDSSIGYNLTDGGEGTLGISNSGEKNPMYGKTPSEETKHKISIANKGKRRSDEIRKKMSIAHKGKKFSDETCKKMSTALKGRISPMKGKHPSDEARKKISTALKGRISPTKGKHISEETKHKISIANKGKHRSDEYCIKMSIARRGKTVSYETRKKISISNKGIKPEKFNYLTENGDIKIMNKATANRWHPDWKLIEE